MTTLLRCLFEPTSKPQDLGRKYRRSRQITSTAIVCLVLMATVTTADDNGTLGMGLYKDGQKVADVEDVTASRPEGQLQASTGHSGRGREFRREVVGREQAGRFREQSRHAHYVSRCSDIVQGMFAAGVTQAPDLRDVERLLVLEDSLLDARRLLSQKYDMVAADLLAKGYPSEKRERHNQVGERHLQAADQLLGLLSGLRSAHLTSASGEIESRWLELRQFFIDHVFRPEPPLQSAQPLPVQMDVRTAPVRDYEQPGPPIPVRRSYAAALSPEPEDLLSTIDVQFTPAITDLALTLNSSAVEIYNFVRDNCEFEAYLGSRKGSQQTLDHRRGNDYDQSSLLLALLRVSGIPARYATGTIKMPIDRATNWLGIEDPVSAGSILTTCGMEGVLWNTGGVPDAIQCKRVWVEAWLPFVNYRGAINDATGFQWVTMDPTFKQYEYEYGINLTEEIGFDAEGFVRDYYLSGTKPETPVDVFEQMLTDSLAVRYPGATPEDLITTRSVIKETDGILPGTLPYELITPEPSFSAIPTNMRYEIQFHLYDGYGMDLSYTTSLPEIVQKQVTISYVGATTVDQTIIDDAGGIFNVATPYLVDLRPVLKIDGCVVATASGSVVMGTTHYSDMHFMPPTGAQNVMPTVSNTITAGNYQGIGIDTEDAYPAFFGEVTTTCEENMLGEEQHQLALTYLNECNMADDKVGDLMHMVVTNDIAEAIVENSVTVWYNGYGDPVSMEWTGMIVDADRKIIGPFSVHGADNSCDFMRLGGADGSIQENRLFEVRFEEEAISAVKILEIAADSGIAVCELVPGSSISSQCPGFNHSTSIWNAVNSALAGGHHVIIPEREFTYYEWTGTGYVDIDPLTCAAGYIISGGQNGGATVCVWTEPWFMWIFDAVCMNHVEPVWVLPPATNDMYCADSWAFWTFVVNIDYYGKDDGGICQFKFTLPRYFVVPRTIKSIAATWGAGDYEFKAEAATDICGECTGADKTVTIIKADIEQDKETKCHGETSASLNVTSSSHSPGGYTWSSTPSGISGTGSSITYNPSGLTPGEYTVTAESNDLSGCKDECEVTVFDVQVTPANMNATESLASGTFTCTVTPSGLSPTYQWLTGSADGAWPPTAGNSPALNYSAATASSTTVNATRWFAPTPSRRQYVDGTTSSYNINCKVTVGGVECVAQSASILNVSVDMTGQCSVPSFADWGSIQVQRVGAVWQVTGQGTFHRTAPVPSANMPATSQFHAKAMTHENKHLAQLTTEVPWKDLFDANDLYTSTLSALTSNVSEADLRNQIFAAVQAKATADDAVIAATLCDLEKGAFDAMNAVAPDFLEFDDADWWPLYGCP